MGVFAQQESVAPAERHYAVIEVAEMWHLSPLVIGSLIPNDRPKREYAVPESPVFGTLNIPFVHNFGIPKIAIT